VVNQGSEFGDIFAQDEVLDASAFRPLPCVHVRGLRTMALVLAQRTENGSVIAVFIDMQIVIVQLTHSTCIVPSNT